MATMNKPAIKATPKFMGNAAAKAKTATAQKSSLNVKSQGSSPSNIKTQGTSMAQKGTKSAVGGSDTTPTFKPTGLMTRGTNFGGAVGGKSAVTKAMNPRTPSFIPGKN